MKILVLLIILLIFGGGWLYQRGDIEYWYAIYRLENTAKGKEPLADPVGYVVNLPGKIRGMVFERCHQEAYENWLRTRGLDEDVPQTRDSACAVLFEKGWTPADAQ